MGRGAARRTRGLRAGMARLLVGGLVGTTVVVAALDVGAGVSHAALQTDIVGPFGSGHFGDDVEVLSNGNVVVLDPGFDLGSIDDVGAAYLYNGATHQLISSLIGSQLNDSVGSGGAVEVGDSNVVISSPSWDRGIAADAGAVTWINGTSGLNGSVSEANSVVGTHASDSVGSQPVTALPVTKNYVVAAPRWHAGIVKDVGAVRWADGNSGVIGDLNPSNSLVGSQEADSVGDVTALTNGNYVVSAIGWSNAAVAASVGSVTWGNGADAGARTIGAVTAANSLIGATPNDLIGISGIDPLTNGNYVVSSFLWHRGAVAGAGAVTWGNGAGGTVGAVTIGNSLVGAFTNDFVGLYDVKPLTNGNYVVSSAGWDNGPGAVDAGAVTFRNGSAALGPIGGDITVNNSLIGSTAGDAVGAAGLTPLSNGNYVVASYVWQTALGVNVGAATWGSGTAGIHGPITNANSLIGSVDNDMVSSGGVTALSNGNYVVSSPSWNGVAVAAGAVTWGNGSDAGPRTVGIVTTGNSLVGDQASDKVGDRGVLVLSSGNYVVRSASWHADRGAATFGLGAVTGGVHGTVSAVNSLVGATANDAVGAFDAAALTNGNYVILSPAWNAPGAADAGAATWGSGTVGVSGLVDSTNSLTGARPSDQIGSAVVALPDGTYVVTTGSYVNASQTLRVGVVTLGKIGGTRGLITGASNLVGTNENGISEVVDRFAADGSIVVGRGESDIVTFLHPDATPPLFAAPPPAVTAIAAPGTNSTVVTYSLPAAVEDVGTAVVTCTPPSGSVFPVGTTTVSCTATNTEGMTATTSFSVTVIIGTDYVPFAPARLADTRVDGATVDGQFAGGGPRDAGSTLVLPVAGRGGVPVDAVAVTLNVTVTDPAADGFLTVFPCGSAQPTASNVNYRAGVTIPNAVITKVGAGASVCFFAQQPLNLVVDVNGAFPAGTSFSPINPARVLDTRAGAATIDGVQQGGGAPTPGSITTVLIAGRAGVPKDAAAAVLNVTVTEPASSGYATVYPCGTTPPTASNLNYTPGLTIPNLVVTKLGPGGTICIYSQASTHLIVDVGGYLPASTTFVSFLPGRLLDTRPGASTVDGQSAGAGLQPAGTVTRVHVPGRSGVPAGAATAALNVTVTDPTGAGYVTVYACGIDPPLASNLNFVSGQTIANAVLTQIGTGGDICLYNSQPTHLITDITGYYP
jgi:trimeric autotransporter adhesin